MTLFLRGDFHSRRFNLRCTTIGPKTSVRPCGTRYKRAPKLVTPRPHIVVILIMDSAFAQADLLVELITTSVAQVKKIYRDAKCNLPVLDSPDNVAAPMSPSFRTALRTLQGACSQLTTLLSPPAETIALVCWDISRASNVQSNSLFVPT